MSSLVAKRQSSGGIVQNLPINVPIGQTIDIDTVTSSIHSIVWTVTVVNSTSKQLYHVNTLDDASGSPPFNLFGSVGVKIPHSVDVVGNPVTLKITNTDSEAFDVYITKTTVDD
jgi:hypothetical protein